MRDISFKALGIGIISIVIMGLSLQLIFLLLATAYTNLLKEYPDIASLGSVISYGAGIIGYFIIMSFGGYITAHLAQKKIDLHCLMVSGFVVGFSLITSVRSDNFTYISVLFAFSGLIFTLIGGRAWIKNSQS
jgi:hypothetical protein